MTTRRRHSSYPAKGSLDHADDVRSVGEMVGQGLSAHEIAPRLSMPAARVRRIARRHGIELPKGMGANARRMSVPIAAKLLPALDAVAERAAVDRIELARRILTVALEGDGRGAIRLLGPLAEPKRTYVRRTPEEREAEKRAARAEKDAAARAKEEARQAQEAAQAEAATCAMAAQAAAEAAEAAAAVDRWASRPEWLVAATEAGTHPLRAVRQHLGLRLRDVADRAGLGFYGDNRVGELERDPKPLTPRMRARLAAAIGVEPEWLVTCNPAYDPAAPR